MREARRYGPERRARRSAICAWDVGPLEQLGGAGVNLVAATANLVQPGLLDVLAGKIVRQAGGQLLDQVLALLGREAQGRFEGSLSRRTTCSQFTSLLRGGPRQR